MGKQKAQTKRKRVTEADTSEAVPFDEVVRKLLAAKPAPKVSKPAKGERPKRRP